MVEAGFYMKLKYFVFLVLLIEFGLVHAQTSSCIEPHQFQISHPNVVPVDVFEPHQKLPTLKEHAGLVTYFVKENKFCIRRVSTSREKWARMVSGFETKIKQMYGEDFWQTLKHDLVMFGSTVVVASAPLSGFVGSVFAVMVAGLVIHEFWTYRELWKKEAYEVIGAKAAMLFNDLVVGPGGLLAGMGLKAAKQKMLSWFLPKHGLRGVGKISPPSRGSNFGFKPSTSKPQPGKPFGSKTNGMPKSDPAEVGVVESGPKLYPRNELTRALAQNQVKLTPQEILDIQTFISKKSVNAPFLPFALYEEEIERYLKKNLSLGPMSDIDLVYLEEIFEKSLFLSTSKIYSNYAKKLYEKKCKEITNENREYCRELEKRIDPEKYIQKKITQYEWDYHINPDNPLALIPGVKYSKELRSEYHNYTLEDMNDISMYSLKDKTLKGEVVLIDSDLIRLNYFPGENKVFFKDYEIRKKFFRALLKILRFRYRSEIKNKSSSGDFLLRDHFIEQLKKGENVDEALALLFNLICARYGLKTKLIEVRKKDNSDEVVEYSVMDDQTSFTMNVLRQELVFKKEYNAKFSGARFYVSTPYDIYAPDHFKY